MNPTTILIQAALVLAMLSTPAQASYPPPNRCAQVLPRKEWRTLSTQEQDQYFQGMNKVVRSTFYSQLSKTHDEHNSYIHGWSLFFPWHRAFLMQVEGEMQKTLNNPAYRLPYWNWSLDSQSPEQAPLWGSGPNKLGTGGRDNSCVQDGAFADYAPAYPTGRNCLQREWARSGGRRMDPVASPEVLNRIISGSGSYDEFRRGIEMSPHGGVHISIGGDMAYMHSPNDPAFFFHHAMVDKIWADFQKLPGKANLYDGSQGNFQGARGRRGASRDATVEDVLHPYTDWVVKQTFDTRSLCYFYAELDFKDVVVPDLPPPTVVRPPPQTQPVTQPIRPSQPTQPVRPSQPSQPVRPSQPTQPHREEKKSSSKIKKFFKDLFNDGALDPSQTPIGSGGKAPEPAPVDDKVKMDFIDAPAQLLPTDPKQIIAQEKQINAQLIAQGEDRSELVKLRPQPLIPAKWYEMNGHNVEEARAKEAEYTNTVIQLNQVFGYISPSALWNQVNKVAKLAAADVKDFTATLSRVVVNVENTIKKDAQDLKAASKQAAVDVYARIKHSIGLVSIQNIEKVSSIVKNLIGEAVYSENALTNPYRPRHAHKKSNTSSSASSSSSSSD